MPLHRWDVGQRGRLWAGCLKQGLQQIRALSDAASPEEAERMCRDDSREETYGRIMVFGGVTRTKVTCATVDW